MKNTTYDSYISKIYMTQPKTHLFKNGLRLIYETPTSNLNITYIYTMCRFGSVDETATTRGAAHFIEHMCFKGTPHFPTAYSLMTNYDDIGAYFNATTHKELTNYTVKCGDQYVDACLKMVGEMVFASKFNKVECEKELKVVVEENMKNTTDYNSMVYDIAEEMIFAGTPFTFPVDDISFHKTSLDFDEMIRMYRTYYVPHNTVISIVSNVDYGAIIKMVERNMGKFRSKVSTPCRSIATVPVNSREKIHIKNIRGIDTAYFIMAFHVGDSDPATKHAMTFLSEMMGGRLSSPLYMILREKNGLTYTSDTGFGYFYGMGGYFYLFAISDSSRLIYNGTKGRPGVIPICVDLVSKFVKRGVDQDEIERTKKYMKENLYMRQEQSGAQTYQNGVELLLGGGVQGSFKTEFERNYRDMDKEILDRTIKRYFKKEGMFISLVGGNLPSKKEIMDEFSSIE